MESHRLNLLVDNKLNTNFICNRQLETLVDTSAVSCGIQKTMETLGQRLRYALEQMGMNETELARQTGHSQQAINFIASGKTKNPRNLERIAATLNVSESWLRYGAEQGGTPSQPSNGALLRPFTPEAVVQQLGRVAGAKHDAVNDIPILGTPTGSDGLHIDREDIQSYTDRPPMLYGNHKGFAVYMNGESMSPRFDHGEMLWIDPVQPPQIGDYVLIIKQDGFAIPRQLIAFSADTITLLARNDDTESTIPRDQVREICKIVGSRAL